VAVRRHVLGIAGVLAALAIFAYLVLQGGLAAPERPDVRSPQPIAGGSFEASGVAHVPGTAGVLFVDDGRHREIFWMELGADGRQQAPAVSVPLGADVTDLEGITSDGSHFYVVGSQSKHTGFDGDGLVRFRFDPQTKRTSAVERIRGLKAWLAERVPELKGTARVIGDEALNIEAIAWDARGARLLLGLRAPVVAGKALVIALTLQDPRGPFSSENLRVDGPAIRLPLEGAGIRSLEYDPTARAFRVIAGAGLNHEDRDFRIVEWTGDEAPASLPVVASFSRNLKPEGITRASIAGRPVSVVVFDTSRIALLDPPPAIR
jgi:uncharacterized protein DUF3616